jgi:hypothetical protein
MIRRVSRGRLLLAGLIGIAAALSCTGATSPATLAPQALVAPQQAGTVETYPEWSHLDRQVAAQVWADNTTPASQWAWQPVSPTESHITWGDPNNWPGAESQKERFVRDGDWWYLDGWWGNGTYYRQYLAEELFGDLYDGWDCRNLRPLPNHNAQQHYVLHEIPKLGTGYCLRSKGVIVEQSSGNAFGFAHEQNWYRYGSCWNPNYEPLGDCVRQYELWRHNKNGPWEDNVLQRDVFIERGHGMAWAVLDLKTGGWLWGRPGWTY